MRALLAGLLAALVGLGAAPASAQPRQPERVVTVGTGAMRGTYYPVARAICRVVNRELRAERIRCSAEPTFGSVYNLRLMQAGELDFALVQADVQYQALNGQGPWQGAPFAGLRSVFAAYDEAFVLIAAPGIDLRTLADLRGRRINPGVPGSGTRATWDALAPVLAAAGVERLRLQEGGDVTTALCNGTLDLAATVGFQPSAAIRATLASCPTSLVPLRRGPLTEQLFARHPYFRPVLIPAATYGLPADIETFGMSSDFVTSTRVDARIVGAIARVVADNIEEIALQSPALARLRLRTLAAGLTAPLHPAAEAAYRAAGALP